MLQYLINATMIWLLSLLAFDLLLRRESYHSYNRAYLLLTFAMGILLPLCQWDTGGNLYRTVSATTTYAGVVTAKQNIADATALPATQNSPVQWLWVVYISGVIVFTLLLLKEVWTLIRYYRTGTKSKDGVWHIIETGGKHSPFSAFRYIFISSKGDYEPQELQMILLHEELHGHALHFVDTLLLQLAKIIFWFHPLVYIYNKRLLMVHEYQADTASNQNPEVYGRFLIQQAMLHPAPSISHSFNRSPIKNRILMLTRKSGLAAGFKRLAILPLGIACIFLFTENALSKENRKEGNKLHYNGNVFELWSPYPGPDTVMVENPATGEMELRISQVDSFPVKMNGKEIFRVGELSRSEKEQFDKTTGLEVKNYFLGKMLPVMRKMTDGNYAIYTYIILDEKGKIVYTHPPAITDRDWRMNKPDTYDAQVKLLQKELYEILEQTNKKFTPVKRGGRYEIMRLEEILPRITFHVKNHEVSVSAE